MNWQIHRVEEIHSTNTALKQMAREGATQGTVLIAARQTEGHGRFDRRFHSPSGGLYMSLLLRHPSTADVTPLITVAAATAAAEACEQLVGRTVSIKWVNDLFLDGRKVCGILAESVTDPATGMVCTVVGFGVNVTAPTEGCPPEIAAIAGGLLPQADAAVRDRLANDLLARFARYLAALQERAFLPGYRARSLLIGQTVSFWEDGQAQQALVTGVDDNGGLMILQDGVPRVLIAGEVTLHRMDKK